MRLNQERILLIGDMHRQMHPALQQAMPGAHITMASTYFDGIAELSSNAYTAVIASAEPIERRPEAAVKTLRQLAGGGRLLLFGHPTLEPLSRKMLDFGCDDYLVTPATPEELLQMFGTPPLRLGPEPASDDAEPVLTTPPTRISMLSGLPLADIMLDAMLQHPHDAPAAAVRRINAEIAPTMQLHFTHGAPPDPEEGFMLLSHGVRVNNENHGALHLVMPQDDQETLGRHFLAQLAHSMGKIVNLQDRHNALQKLAITDDLTGLYNGRYFRHFLSRIVDRARTMRFPVTLLLFDIDNFKKYNDQYGHGVGDDILRATASLMKRCVRDHDLVARISGDEFAVVFWEKDGPRQPRESHESREPRVMTPSRPPQEPQQIFKRFQRLIATQDFPGLGPSGQGTLTISGGLAVFPYDAGDVPALIAAADRALMFGAKQAGKNSIFLVGADQPDPPESDSR